MFSKSMFFTFFVASSLPVFAVENNSERIFQAAIGIGPQYGGLVGAQLSLATESDKYYLSVGLIGMSAGYQYVIDDTQFHSVGVNVGGVVAIYDYITFGQLTYDYHLGGFLNDDFVFGASIGFADEGDDGYGSFVAFNIGYKF